MPTPPFPATRFPPWLAHVLRAQRGPVPWNAVLRGALAAVPLLLSVLAERPTAGVPAALGAMLARGHAERDELHDHGRVPGVL
ncbi:hypothetical protein AB0886_27175, partial [Streptomyces sp. NPDC024062]